MLLHIPAGFCRTGQLEERLRRLVRAAAGALAADAVTLWLVGDDEHHLVGALNHGAAFAATEDHRLPMSGNIVADAARRGMGWTLTPDAGHADPIAIPDTSPVRSAIAVPVFVGPPESQRTAGTLSAFNQREDAPFAYACIAELSWWSYLIGVVLRDYGADATPDRSRPAAHS